MNKERSQNSLLSKLTRRHFVKTAGAVTALGATSLSGLQAWAGCSIFPGKAVAGRGWCSAWSPKH
jgi:hypothetical protein